jgi:hypothetical protein
VLFDQPLTVAALDERAWYLRYADHAYPPASPAVLPGDPFAVNLLTSTPEPEVGDPTAQYDGLDPALQGQNGVPVAAFAIPLELA